MSRSRPRPLPIALVTAAGLIVSAVALGQGTDPSHPVAGVSIAEAPATEPSAPSPVRLVAASSGVTDGDGNVLYRYGHDRPSESTCFAACAASWSPVLSSGRPEVSGIDPSLVGLVRRPDGTWQVTLGGWPLYRHAAVS